MAARRNYKTPTVGIEVTDADTAAFEALIVQEKASKGKRIRKPPVTKRTAEDDMPSNNMLYPTIIEAQAVATTTPDTDVVLEDAQQRDMGGGHGLQLTSSQLQAIELLADMHAKYNAPQVAELIGVDERTVYRWLTRPLFLEALELRTRASFIPSTKFKMYRVYDHEMGKNSPGSRVLEQVAKTLGFFSDSDTISVNVDVHTNQLQADIDKGRTVA